MEIRTFLQLYGRSYRFLPTLLSNNLTSNGSNIEIYLDRLQNLMASYAIIILVCLAGLGLLVGRTSCFLIGKKGSISIRGTGGKPISTFGRELTTYPY
uniref:Uncharacterized protein n=1 Tax=Picea glauca TaxID=3330 RepID=A0A117NGG9_PICGL|nr:hypothetical protein ABT39_MTgene1412 [Picea glauca]QHR92397.1 hypothetical protein Q903MT_gene6440 [Picea sitchensis]